ncbi:MAG: phosphoethanolamine--lipid A transferase [Pseudomonadales bacterium]
MTLVLLVSAFIVATGNMAFFTRLEEAYPLAQGYAPFLLSTVLVQISFLAMVLSLVCVGRFVKPVLALTLLIAAAISCIQDGFGVVIDEAVLRSVIATDKREATELFSLSMGLRMLLQGVIAATIVMLVRLRIPDFRHHLVATSGTVGIGFLVIVMCFAMFSATYISFFREHKIVRYYSNPLSALHALAGTVTAAANDMAANKSLTVIAQDVVLTDRTRPRLVVMVVGEAARARNSSVNGYERNTNPFLGKRDVFSFQHMTSCGTATAVSVPCLFSALPRRDFSVEDALVQENLLDIAQRSGVSVLWRDNNSDSKGVALRVPYQDFKHEDINPICDPECRDVGMLTDLQGFIDSSSDKDLLIVLHQMGSHGPAYYRRYPEVFEMFSPVCKDNELSACSDETIRNAYDNSIRYTDYFLDAVIKLLVANENSRDTAMVYVGDHGESLGEYGIYLHGMPYSLAPAEQTEVPLVLWFGNGFPVDRSALRIQIEKPASHDAIFATMLELLGITSNELHLQTSLVQVSD